ncbi:hypothetical protein C8R41DRAFT_863761 [Lentinula lateritia]|uniref:Uncharacterized protein n=1 Tax=Lentinula lateritia TaxID=40482 RepID=A0ABQ8VVZ4_9AGAR|nr:hypothetical protein C8R41DRAFT_863761 [Lentinula lateritia]
MKGVYKYEEDHALKPQKLLLNKKNKQLELVQERSLEIRRQDEDEAYQAKNNKIEKEIVAIRQKVHKLQLEKEELQSMLQVGEASSSNKLQVCAFYSERDLLEASLKQAWECKNSELKVWSNFTRNCEEFNSLKKEVEALETILGEKDQQLQSNEQHRLEIDSALQSYQSLEQVRATRYRELVKELTAAKQEVHLREAQNEKLQLSFEAMEYSLQARLQEQQKVYQSFDAQLNDMSRRKDLLKISLKEAWECKNQELEKEIQIQENELETSRLNASLQRKEEENDYEDSIEDAVEQLEASCNSLEADLQSEEVKVRDREASLLQEEADHAIICKSLEDRLSAFRRDNQTKVSKMQLKDTQQKLIRANKKNIKSYQDHIAGIEQKVAESQAQGEEMQCQIMQLEYELAQRQTQSKDIHSTVSILQDKNLAKALFIGISQGTSSTMQADQFRVSSPSTGEASIPLMQGIHFGGLNKSLRKAAVVAELRMTTKWEYVLRLSKSKQSRVHMESEEEQDSDEENGKEY